MISTFFHSSNIKESSVSEFFESSIIYFYNELSRYLANTNRVFEKYHLIEYGEMTLVNFFINGIIRNDEINIYTILNEFATEKTDVYNSGRADIVIEDTILKEVFYIETKISTSKENAPDSRAWKDKSEIIKGYTDILEQADRYLKIDWKNYLHPAREKFDRLNLYTFYKVAMIFDSVRFIDDTKILHWNYIPELDNEFYAFKTFPHKNSVFGLACYGLVEKVEVKK